MTKFKELSRKQKDELISCLDGFHANESTIERILLKLNPEITEGVTGTVFIAKDYTFLLAFIKELDKVAF